MLYVIVCYFTITRTSNGLSSSSFSRSAHLPPTRSTNVNTLSCEDILCEQFLFANVQLHFNLAAYLWGIKDLRVIRSIISHCYTTCFKERTLRNDLNNLFTREGVLAKICIHNKVFALADHTANCIHSSTEH